MAFEMVVVVVIQPDRFGPIHFLRRLDDLAATLQRQQHPVPVHIYSRICALAHMAGLLNPAVHETASVVLAGRFSRGRRLKIKLLRLVVSHIVLYAMSSARAAVQFTTLGVATPRTPVDDAE